MKSKRVWLLAPGLLVLVVAAWWWGFWGGDGDRRPVPGASIKIGTILGDISAPIFLAQQRGYFAAENLNADVVLFQAGADAVAALLEGRVDFASAAEYVFVHQAFKNRDLRIVGVISTGQITEVIARTDRGMNKPRDLRGKRIGVARGTHADYYLGRFLALQGLSPNEVEIVETKPSEQAGALTSGYVDAIVSWEPHLSRTKRQITQKTAVWDLRDHDFYWLLLSREQTLSNGDIQDRLIRALIRADAALEADPVGNRQLVSQFVGEQEQPRSSWDRYYFQFTLPQPLLSVMEEEARWTIENHLTDADRVPNYLEYLDLASLARVNSRAVTVIQ